ncbi:hypothetical protein EVU94_08225 [Flavobacteriaceae bacterium 144Ye]|uniref:hypothetical protein n=1 Tax=Mesoflavibacter sp. CH_XMU1422-2 TaxID=3107770 RepID=UPI00101BF73F|nr:hypothetical protein [Mesoflavibacter sp.]RYH73970.1 hypothetical protein EVU94_08225 [Flavobacteriaceae bacterium 144Ye]|tara:strand:+ start:912 stop:1205 length:294 start_codon:yes stop_codon:yes gene_type:complete
MKSQIHEHLKTNKLIVSKTVSKFLLALTVILAISITSCRDTKKEETNDDHGHEHNADGSHKTEHEDVKQEEFNVDKDSMKSDEKTHTHDNGEEHHDH